jgi:hypothetical protein
LRTSSALTLPGARNVRTGSDVTVSMTTSQHHNRVSGSVLTLVVRMRVQSKFRARRLYGRIMSHDRGAAGVRQVRVERALIQPQRHSNIAGHHTPKVP